MEKSVETGGRLVVCEQLKAVKVGQNVRCLLEQAMELGKGNSSAME